MIYGLWFGDLRPRRLRRKGNSLRLMLELKGFHRDNFLIFLQFLLTQLMILWCRHIFFLKFQHILRKTNEFKNQIVLQRERKQLTCLQLINRFFNHCATSRKIFEDLGRTNGRIFLQSTKIKRKLIATKILFIHFFSFLHIFVEKYKKLYQILTQVYQSAFGSSLASWSMVFSGCVGKFVASTFDSFCSSSASFSR